MVFRHRVCSLVPMSRDALRSCDVDESIIADAMGFLRDRANRCQLLFRMYKAFVASGNVVIDFDPEDSAFLRALDNLNRVAALESIRADANVVAPTLFVLRWSSQQAKANQIYTTYSHGQLCHHRHTCIVYDN